MLDQAQAGRVLETADLLCPPKEVEQALQRVAGEISAQLANDNPLVLAVMTGAVVFAGQLLPLLNFPLEFDYVHVTRYGNATVGGTIEWKQFPVEKIAGRTVLVVDDILDEGHTLAAIRRRALEAGAAKFYSAVFAEKKLSKAKPIAADFVGVELPDRYVFGYGLDVKGAWRNLPAIYAMKKE